ncbi:MAG: GNAT family N-acetyltransferase [Oscillospiraceae bacterium]|nr:GNAT family N-acetyltransferase [Oscillospiraceae bacterium]
MRIRKTRIEDLGEAERIYANARTFMVKTGNPGQWINGYPGHELLLEDIRRGEGYVCEDEDGIQAVFMFFTGPEPTYAYIEDGSWPDDEPYGTVHRLASAGRRAGVGAFCLGWCLEQCGNLRVDTHRDNRPMQELLSRCGFTPCGRVYMEDGSPRIAYYKKGI